MAFAASTMSAKSRAASLVPTTLPTITSQAKSAAFVLKKPLKTNSG